jgi:hypothetical protein
MMASPHALLETQALKQLAQIVETDGRIGGAAEKQSQCLLSPHNDILRPNRTIDGRTQFLSICRAALPWYDLDILLDIQRISP